MSDEERLVNPGDLPEEPIGEPPIDPPPAEEMGEAGEATEAIGESVSAEAGESDVPAADETGEFQLPEGPVEPPTGRGTVTESTDDDRLMAALAWFSMVILQLPIISVILLLVEPNKDQPFQRYHSVTSTLFYVAAFIYEILAAIAFAILSAISLGCLALCLWVIFFFPHLIALYYAFQAYSGKAVEIPLISDFARSQDWI